MSPSTRTLSLMLELPHVGPPGYDPFWDDEPDYWHRHYDREGEPITMRMWATLFEYAGLDYRRVARDEIGRYTVSTVWLGLDHNYFLGGRPHIFETMVFADETAEDLAMNRYSSEQEALEGHQRICEEVRLTTDALGTIDPGILDS